MRYLILFVLSVAPLASLPAAEPLTLELLPAWDGFVRPGVTTEIGVRLVAERGGEITLTATATTATTQVHAHAHLEPNLPLTLWLAVRPDADNAPVVAARMVNGVSLRREVNSLQTRSTRLVAVVQLAPENASFDTGSSDREGITLFHPDIASLPHAPQAYQVIDALLLDAAALERLDAAQLAALQGYLGTCGRLLISGPPAMLEVLQESAGCQGRFVQAVTHPAKIVQELGLLLHDRPSALPGAASLHSLLPSEQRQWLGLAVFFSGYALILVLLAFTIRRAWLLLLVPVAATGLGLAVWSYGEMTGNLLSWAEMTSGDRTACYSALLQVAGKGKGMYTLTIPRAFGLPVPLRSDTSVELDWDNRQPAVSRLILRTRLLAPQEFLLTGDLTVTAPLTLDLTPTGPRLVNVSRFPTAAGVLAWQGRPYTVPPLAAGEHWLPPDRADNWGSTAIEQLLRVQSAADGAALLIPFTLKDAGLLAAADGADGWLLIRPRREL